MGRLIKRYREERGAELVEYALIAAALVAVFAVIGMALRAAADRRANEAARTVESAAPCAIGQGLDNDRCL